MTRYSDADVGKTFGKGLSLGISEYPQLCLILFSITERRVELDEIGQRDVGLPNKFLPFW